MGTDRPSNNYLGKEIHRLDSIPGTLGVRRLRLHMLERDDSRQGVVAPNSRRMKVGNLLAEVAVPLMVAAVENCSPYFQPLLKHL